jgi:hypothetical protein
MHVSCADELYQDRSSPYGIAGIGGVRRHGTDACAGHSDANGDADPDGHPYAHTYPIADSHAHPDAHADTHIYGDAHCHPHPDLDADIHTHPDALTDADVDPTLAADLYTDARARAADGHARARGPCTARPRDAAR